MNYFLLAETDFFRLINEAGDCNMETAYTAFAAQVIELCNGSMDNQRIHGNFFQLLSAAMAFIFKHLSLSGTTDTLEREEHLTIPYKAIREGVLNSLAHRSYRDAGGSVSIAIYDDRVEIENPGSFPPNWDVEKMKSEHESKPQNPLIANVLYKRKVLESWGRGIGLMLSECRKADLPEPEYIMDADSVRLIFRYEPVHRPSTDQVPTKHRPSVCLDKDIGKQGTVSERNNGRIRFEPSPDIQDKLSASGFE